jgi:xanthine dehydrogenase accessory factor
MSAWHAHVLRELDSTKGAILVSLGAVKGSAPREAGTQMLVTPTRQYGTIGGGALEFGAAARARQFLLESGPNTLEETIILGPDIGQCCGGQVVLVYERLSGEPDAIRQRLIKQSPPLAPLFLFGAGHVGKALVHTLQDLPFAIHWVDGRPESFAHPVPHGVQTLRLKQPEHAVKTAPKGALFLVMTHDHDLDYQIVRAVLRHNNFAFCGLIGSNTKRARFVQRFRREGLDQSVLTRLTCPVGLAGIPGKAPEAIAIAIAAQLLTLKRNKP